MGLLQAVAAHACNPHYKRTHQLLSGKYSHQCGVGGKMDTRIYSEKMINSIKSHLEKNESKFITYPKFVFLCGKAIEGQYENTNRGILENYLKKQSQDVYIVLSEQLWEDGFDSNIDLLTFEEFLAEISDAIILFCESPGSYCELGAFAYANKLFSDKLVIVVDEQYKGAKSFIMTGPVAKAKQDGATIVYAQLDNRGLLASKELRVMVRERVEQFSSKTATLNRRKCNTDEEKVLISSFIVELLECIKLLQPVSKKDLIDLYKKIKGFSSFTFVKRDGDRFHNTIKYDYIIKLLATVELIKIKDEIITSTEYSKTQRLMLRYYGNGENKERNKILCKKYRYGGINK